MVDDWSQSNYENFETSLRAMSFNFRNSDDEAPLFATAEHDHLMAVKALLSCKPHANVISKDGQASLFATVTGTHTEVVKLLLQYEIDFLAGITKAKTPTHQARKHGQKEVGKVLEGEMKKGKKWVQEWI